MQQDTVLYLVKRLYFQQLLVEMKCCFSSTNPLSSSPDPMEAIPRSALWIKTTVVVLFKVGLNENRRGGMCSVEEEPALGHPGAASRSASGGQKHRDLQLVLPSERGCGTPFQFTQVQYLGEGG